MKTILVFIALAVFINITAANEDQNTTIEKYKKEIMDAERAFSKMSAEKGMAEAFLFFASEEVIKLKNKDFPSMNREEMKKDFEGFDAVNSPKLTWEPEKVDVSESGDLGYAFGKWVMEGKDENGNPKKGYGVYVTVWKRQTDGSWKYVLDGGNSTPPPSN